MRSTNRTRNVAKMPSDVTRQLETEKGYAIQKRKRLVRRLTIFFLFVFVASYFVISTLVSQASSLEKRESEKEKLLQELADLQAKQDVLKEEIIKLNDDDYIAKLARRDYFLSEEGEIIFNIPEKKNGK